jgi:hypothetical protein
VLSQFDLWGNKLVERETKMSDLEHDARMRADSSAVDTEERLERIERVLRLIAIGLFSAPFKINADQLGFDDLRDFLVRGEFR